MTGPVRSAVRPRTSSRKNDFSDSVTVSMPGTAITGRAVTWKRSRIHWRRTPDNRRVQGTGEWTSRDSRAATQRPPSSTQRFLEAAFRGFFNGTGPWRGASVPEANNPSSGISNRRNEQGLRVPESRNDLRVFVEPQWSVPPKTGGDTPIESPTAAPFSEALDIKSPPLGPGAISCRTGMRLKKHPID